MQNTEHGGDEKNKNEIDWIDLLPPEIDVDKYQSRIQGRAKKRNLAVCALYAVGYTQEKVGNLVGITQKAVCVILRKNREVYQEMAIDMGILNRAYRARLMNRAILTQGLKVSPPHDLIDVIKVGQKEDQRGDIKLSGELKLDFGDD